MKRTFIITLSAAFAVGLLSQVLPVRAQEKLPPLRRLASGDVNGDGKRDISDTVYLLNWLFAGGPEPIKPDGEDPPAEVLASIQESAAMVLASLPTEEQIAKLPRRISNGFLRARELFAAAAANAATWTRPDVERYTVEVHWVAVLMPNLTWTLCKYFPEACVDQECLDRCEAEYDACFSGCPSPLLDPIGYLDCSVQCDTAYIQCTDGCTNWGALTAH